MEFDLTQPVETLDKVPEDFRPLYAQGQDGKFAVDPKYTTVTKAIIGLNGSLKSARDDLKKRTPVDLSPLAEFGSDPAAIKAAFDARVAELTAKGGDAAKAVDKVRQEMTEANRRALDAANAKTAAYQTQLYTMLVENTALAAVSEAKGLPELLMPFIKNQVKVVEEDGKFVVHVTDDKGERRYSGVTGQPMTIKELVAGMKSDPKFGRLFESDNQAGGGGMPPGAGARTPTQQQGSRTANQKIAAGLGKGRYAGAKTPPGMS